MDLSRHIAQKFSELSSPLSDAALDKIASILVRTEVKKNTLYLKEGEVSKYIGYVYKGMLRLFYYKNKKDLTEHFACEGTNFFSIESFFRQQPTHLMIEALENSVVYGLPHDELLELAAEHYEIEVMYRTLIENSLILSQQKADTLRFESANERYRRLLREHPEIIQRAPLSHIASYLLMTPETLSRVRASLV
jgi:CRP-like cAMP-binding protein